MDTATASFAADNAPDTFADSFVEELAARPVTHAPTMGNVAKVRYTHVDMIDYILAHPAVSQNELAARYGYTPAWVSNIMASDAWQSAMAARREEIVNPALRDTIEERMRGLTLQSINVLQAKLESPSVSDAVALKAFELGAKNLGFGQPAPTAPVGGASLEHLAERLVELQRKVRPPAVIDVIPLQLEGE